MKHLEIFENYKSKLVSSRNQFDLDVVKNAFKKGIKDKTFQCGECVNKSWELSVPRPKDWVDENDTKIGKTLSELLKINVDFDSNVTLFASWESEEDDEQQVLSFSTDSKSDMNKVLLWIKQK